MTDDYKINLRAEQYYTQEFRDNAAVLRFAEMMQIKLSVARVKGRGGWDRYGDCGCTDDHLRTLLREHVEKGDPVDVANIAMMLWHRGASTRGRPAMTAPLTPEQIAELECERDAAAIDAARAEGER